jgi:FG-GAP-like repeat/Invasin, domain 3/IPT/TIG domain/Secretion system C-terminal sorting domain/FG-GAP repeat
MKHMCRSAAAAALLFVFVQRLSCQTINSFSPLADTVGGSVTITGTAFSTTAGNNVVHFGQERATVTSASSTSLTVTVPASASYGPVSVTVVGAGTAYSTLSFDPEFHSGDLSDSSGNLSQTISLGGSPFIPTVVDVDGDGKPDILVSRPDYPANTVSFLHNTSSGGAISFAAPTEITGTNATKIVAADLEGTGKPDYIFLTDGEVSVYRNSGTPTSPTFALWTSFNNPDMSGGTWEVQSGEITIHQSLQIFSLLAGAGLPTSFPDNSVVWVPNYTTNMKPEDVAVADFNGDGLPDIAIAYRGNPTLGVNGRVRIYFEQKVTILGNTTYSFSLGYDAEIRQPVFNNELDAYSIAAADLNGDGKPDLVVAGNFNAFPSSGMVTVLMNVNGTTFVPALNWQQNARIERVVLADFDGDGEPDIAYESIDDHSIRIMRNECSGDSLIEFSDPTVISSTEGENSLTVADYDGDGKPDLVWASEAGGNYIKVARNTGTSGTVSFATPVTIPLPGVDFPGAIAVGDLDGDGRPDVVTMKQLSDVLAVVQNEVPPYSLSRSTITMSSSSIAKGGTSTATLRIKDLNGNDLSTSGLTVAFSLTGTGTSSGTFGATTSGNGVYAATFTGTAVGTQNTVTATISGSTVTSTPAGITVAAGAASISKSTITISRSQLADASTATACLQARDTNGDTLLAGGLTGISFFLKGGTSTGTFGSVVDSGNGKYYCTFTASNSGTADSIDARVGTDTVKSALPTVTVNAGTFSTSTSVLSVSSTSVLVGDTISLTLQVKDGSGNNITVGGLDVEIQIFGSTNPYDNGSGYLTNVVDNQNGTYSAKFIGLSGGSTQTGFIAEIYNPSQFVQSYQQVNSFPPQVTVKPMPFSYTRSYVEVNQATTYVNGQIVFDFVAYDSLGQPYTQQDISVVFYLENNGTAGGSADFGTMSYVNTGLYTFTWQATGIGTPRTLIVTVNGDTVTTTKPTITVLPYAPALSYPGHSQTAVPTDTTISWSASTGATSYRVQISADSANGSVIIDTSGITGTQLSVSGLWNYRNYVWRAIVYIDTVEGYTADTASFRTIVSAPLLGLPTARESNLFTTVPFAWDSTLGAASYELQVATDSLFAGVVDDAPGLTKELDTLATLSAGTRYFWRVRASGDGGTSSWSEVRSFTTADNSLAVQATGFTAVPDVGSVTLSWRTQSEVDNAGFNILREDPGTKAFKIISGYSSNDSLRGLGTSSSGQRYGFTDDRVISGNTYRYVVECVSAVGYTRNLDTLSVAVEVPKVYALYQNYPNPFNPGTTIRFDLKETSAVLLEVYDILGQRVLEENYGTVSAGRYDKPINMARFASGVYFFRVIAHGTAGDRFVSIKKMLLLK